MSSQAVSRFQEELKIGDTVGVWWGRKRATIIGFKPHPDREGWRIAVFGDGIAMTMEPEMVVNVHCPESDGQAEVTA